MYNISFNLLASFSKSFSFSNPYFDSSTTYKTFLIRRYFLSQFITFFVFIKTFFINFPLNPIFVKEIFNIFSSTTRYYSFYLIKKYSDLFISLALTAFLGIIFLSYQ
jgi:hypothetical protein